MDNLFEQMTAISKGSAYDAIRPEYERLQRENLELKSTIAKLEIMLKGEQARVEALKNFINEVRPDDAESTPLNDGGHHPDWGGYYPENHVDPQYDL